MRTIRDISDYTGYLPEVQKEWLKYLHIAKTGCEYFLLSDLFHGLQLGSSSIPFW